MALALGFSLFFTGCVSSRYKEAPKDTPPPQTLNVAFPTKPIEAMLGSIITFDGPGSWKRDAFWDEYVVLLRNPGGQPLTVSTFTLVDLAGTGREPGVNPWALEQESKTLEQKYKDAGLAFVRYTTPWVLITGAGAAAVGSAGLYSAAAGTAAIATLVALPIYYTAVLTINHYNKVAMEKEFDHRRIVLPLTLAPGESRTGSLFFPMVPSPRALHLQWSGGTTSGEAVLPLDFLSGLHLKTPAIPASPKLSVSKSG